MKKYCSFFIVLFASAVMLSCKKNDPAKEKDYAASIKDRTWWGKMTKAGETAQYYQMHFNADKTLAWHQLVGFYTGTWSLNGNKLTLSFSGPDVTITADITNDDQLTNITSSTADKINSGEAITVPDIALDNTVWKGFETDFTGHTIPLQLTFMHGYLVEVVYANVKYLNRVYSRSLPGGAFRFDLGLNFRFFGFNISATEMRGVDVNYKFSFQLTKQ